MKNAKEWRQEIVDKFIDSLKNNPAEWKKMWSCAEEPFNGSSNRRYRGMNRLQLQFYSWQKGYTDPRFYTFKQIKDAGLHLKKGSKSTSVSYWFPFDKKEKKMISFDDYNKLRSQPDFDPTRYVLSVKYYNVFNAEDVEGLEPYKRIGRDINPSEVITTISKKMGVPIINDGGDKAYYRSSTDDVHLPEPRFFDSDAAYNAVALHELGHATGHESRLDRKLGNAFGSKEYAYEELVAELTSCFVSHDLPTEQPPEMVENHKAYIQDWISVLESNPDVLQKAAGEAEKAADYLEEKGGLLKEAVKSIDVPEDEKGTVPERKPLKDLMADAKVRANGVNSSSMKQAVPCTPELG